MVFFEWALVLLKKYLISLIDLFLKMKTQYPSIHKVFKKPHLKCVLSRVAWCIKIPTFKFYIGNLVESDAEKLWIKPGEMKSIMSQKWKKRKIRKLKSNKFTSGQWNN